MITKFIEAVNQKNGGYNYGKFMVGKFTDQDWNEYSHLKENRNKSLLQMVGWSQKHLLVFDLQTGEGGMFLPGGFPSADLNKHKIWVCPLFEPFLGWLYAQPTLELEKLPSLIDLDADSSWAGYRRPGK